MIPQEPRPVRLKTVIEIINKKPLLLKMGAIFSIVGASLGTVFIIVIPLLGQNDVPEMDYKAISESGQTATATITGIETQYNLTINNQHPSILSYRYMTDGEFRESKFKTLSPDKVNRMHVGDSISIKHMNGKSIITSLEPFDFPFGLFFTLPIVFLLLGLPCVVLFVHQIRNEVRLMKFGIITDAEVIAITHKPGLPLSKAGQGVKIHYQYRTMYDKTYLNDCFTSDLSYLNSLRQGDIIKIFVSPEDGSKSIIVSRLDSVRNNWNI